MHLLHLILLAASSVALELTARDNSRSNALEQLEKTTNPAMKQSLFWAVNCFDLYDAKECELLRDKWGFCKFASKNRMGELCRKTCGLCDCSKTKYKCCEDGTTAKADMQGSNCPECKDTHPEVCENFSRDCNDLGWAGRWMHNNCKKTCQICKVMTSACEDEKDQKEFCPTWKKYGMCNVNGSLMKRYCKKTCGFCDLDSNKTEVVPKKNDEKPRN